MKRAILISESSVYTGRKGEVISKGGGEGSMHKLAVELVSQGWNVRVLAIREFSDQKARETIDGVTYIRHPVRSKTSWRIFSYLKWCLREAREADYVFVNQFSPHLVLPFLKRGVRKIAIIHDVYKNRGLLFWIKQFGLVSGIVGAFIERLCLRFDKKCADKILTVSEDSKKKILKAFGGKFGGKISIVSWPVSGDAGRVLLSDKKDFILFVGRFVDYKNPSHVLYALKEIKKKFPLFKAVFVVSRVDKCVMNEFTSLRYSLGLIMKDCLILENVSHDELQKLYKEAKVLVHPSHVEGQGMVLPEALVWHTPVVAYDLDAYEGLRSCSSGVKVVSFKDGVDGFSRACVEVLSNYPKWFKKAIFDRKKSQKKFAEVVRRVIF